MEFLKIDGSFGEGGGQIIRTAITLSCITKKSVRIENIRKKRRVPGLRRQHLIAIKLLGKICNADIKGLNIGSTSIEFIPHNVEDKILEEDVGTAGSICLIVQVLIPAVAFCGKNLQLSIIGGTDVPWSPTSNYTRYVLSEAYSRMGINFSFDIKKRGYYPKGGGLINLHVRPCKKLKPIILDKRKTKQVNLYCSFSNLLKETIVKKMERIQCDLESSKFDVESELKNEIALNSGSTILISSKDSDSIIGIDSLMDLKTMKFVPNISQKFVDSKWSVDSHLSDMLVIPSCLSKEMSIFKVKEISSHLETNLYVTSKITGCKYGIGKLTDGYEVRIIGNSDTSI